MPYLTQINGATVELGTDTPIITLPTTGVLNNFGESTQFDSYNVLGDTDPTVTQPGEFVAPVIGGEPLPGTYGGGVEFSNLGLSLAGGLLSVTVNPIEGDYFIGEDGSVYIITEDPLDADNITVNASAIGLNLVNASLTELIDNPVVNTLAPNLTVNGLLNSVVTTQTPLPGETLVVPTEDIDQLVCFAAGTMIQTPQGCRLVEDLEVGDLVSTKDNGDKPLQWIGSRRLDAATLRANPHLQAIRIRAGALGDGIPSSDLLVSPQHRVLVRSKIAIRMFDAREVLVAAKQLLSLDGIDIADDLETVEYYHFLFDQHEVVLSNGAETESLYTGPQALKGVGKAAAEEIFALFPELKDEDYQAHAARPLLSGRQGRKLAMRHLSKDRPLVM